MAKKMDKNLPTAKYNFKIFPGTKPVPPLRGLGGLGWSGVGMGWKGEEGRAGRDMRV